MAASLNWASSKSLLRLSPQYLGWFCHEQELLPTFGTVPVKTCKNYQTSKKMMGRNRPNRMLYLDPIIADGLQNPCDNSLTGAAWSQSSLATGFCRGLGFTLEYHLQELPQSYSFGAFVEQWVSGPRSDHTVHSPEFSSWEAKGQEGMSQGWKPGGIKCAIVGDKKSWSCGDKVDPGVARPWWNWGHSWVATSSRLMV